MLSRRLFVTTAVTGVVAAGGVTLWPSKGTGQIIPAEPWAEKLVQAAESQIGVTLIYDPSYRQIDYPGGDVPRRMGVCTDVVIRAYRDGLGLDLQKLVHDDMTMSFSAYPKLWGLGSTDTNIDHRRVPNLRTFFKRRGSALPATAKSSDCRPGDVVSQLLSNGRPHIGIVSRRMNTAGTAPLLVHNIGLGARVEDVLFAMEIAGHYRFAG